MTKLSEEIGVKVIDKSIINKQRKNIYRGHSILCVVYISLHVKR